MACRSLAEVKGSGRGPKTVADGCQAWPATLMPEQGPGRACLGRLRRSGLAVEITWSSTRKIAWSCGLTFVC